MKNVVDEKEAEKKKAADKKAVEEKMLAEMLEETKRERLEKSGEKKPETQESKPKEKTAQVEASDKRFDLNKIAPLLEEKFQFSAMTAESAAGAQHEKTEQKLQYSFDQASGRLVLSGSAKDWETMMKAMEDSFDASDIPKDQRYVVINMPDPEANEKMRQYAKDKGWHIKGDEENEPPVPDSKDSSAENSIGRASSLNKSR